jgi:hypothetical protein
VTSLTSEVKIDIHKPFSSVGLICLCGSAVSGMENVITKCKNCGNLYIISVSILEIQKIKYRGRGSPI